MSSVDDLLKRLHAINNAVDAMSAASSIDADLQELALRGIAVQGLCAFEQFMRDRAIEWVALLSTKRLPVSMVPNGGEQWRNRIVDRLPRRFKNTDPALRPRLFEELAKSLASFSGPSLVAHDLFFDWAGSNVQLSDVEGVASLFGVKNGWGDMTTLWRKIDPTYPTTSQISAKSLFQEVTDTRHGAAHDADLNVGMLNVQSVSRHVLLLALLFDCTCSTGVDLMCSNKPAEQAVAGKISIRALKKDGTKWSEFSPGKSQRAYRRHKDLDTALAESAGRLSNPFEIVVAYDGNSVVDWRTRV